MIKYVCYSDSVIDGEESPDFARDDFSPNMNSNSIVSPKTFLAYSLGCRTNQAEIEAISLQLTGYGLRQLGEGLQTTDYRLQQPDIILLNTCVVTAKAEKETRQKIRELRKKYPQAFLVVLGCGVNAKNKFNTTLPAADLYITNEEKENITEIIYKCIVKRDPSISVGMTMDNCHPDRTAVGGGIPLSQQLEAQTKVCYYNNRRKRSLHEACPELAERGRDNGNFNNKYIQSGRKFIKIQDGCDGGCSFCLTQFLRGKPTSIPSTQIIEEINFWVKNGIKEIILTGINIGLYHSRHSDQVPPTAGRVEESLSLTKEEGDPSNLAGITNLIKRILNETQIARISFSSIYPEMLTGDFLAIVVKNPRITQCFHLSLQSGSQTVLERMNRKTDLKELLTKLRWIKKQNPFFTFRADIITGFPDETEKEFQETLNFIKKAKISSVHLFHFSVRPDTKAGQMIKSGKWSEVPPAIKKQRAEKIKIAVEEIGKKEAEKMIGRTMGCLIVKKVNCHSERSAGWRRVEKSLSPANYTTKERDPSTEFTPSEIEGLGMTQWEGITENGILVRARDRVRVEKRLKGKILPIKITGLEKNYLVGEIKSLPTN